MIADAVAERLRADVPSPTVEVRPALLDRAGLAQATGLSTSTIDRLRSQGLPAIRIGDAVRFELAAALDWIREHGDDAPPRKARKGAR